MANLFLGFPVARAKIADMIATAAPPLAHHEQHENDGDDEIDITDLEGGAVGLSFDDFIIENTFQSLDGFSQEKSDGEAADFTSGQLRLQTLSSANSFLSVYQGLVRDNPLLTWNKDRKFRTSFWINVPTDEHGAAWIGIGSPFYNEPYVGFKIQDGILYAASCNGSSMALEAIRTLGPGSFNTERRVSFTYEAATQILFYEGGVLRHTVTGSANLPTGSSSATIIPWLDIRNDDHAKQLTLQLNHYKFWQAP